MTQSSIPRRIVGLLGIAMIGYTFTEHIVGIHKCKGSSMFPTLAKNGEWVLSNKLFYGRNSKARYEVGQVVLSLRKDFTEEVICKRITAVPGNELVYVDYITGQLTSVIVPSNHVWLSADNPSNCHDDSRVFGAIPFSLLQGVVFHRFKTDTFSLLKLIQNFLNIDADDYGEFVAALSNTTIDTKYQSSKVYNISRPHSLTKNDWVFLLKFLEKQECCKNISASQRSRLQRLAQLRLGFPINPK